MKRLHNLKKCVCFLLSHDTCLIAYQEGQDIFFHLIDSPVKAPDTRDEISRYLVTPIELITRVWLWIICLSPVNCAVSLIRVNPSQADTRSATKTEVERVFSRGRLLLPHTRNRLSVDMLRKQLCLYSWTKAYVSDQDLDNVARARLCQTRARARARLLPEQLLCSSLLVNTMSLGYSSCN